MTISNQDSTGGRLTLPIEQGIDAEVKELMARLKVDAVRNSDGTSLPDWVSEGLAKVYSTYFPARGDEEWAKLMPEHRVRQYLMSRPQTASSEQPLAFNVMEGYLTAQFAPDLKADRGLYWQVIDRTTGRTLSVDEWTLEAAPPIPISDQDVAGRIGKLPEDAGSAIVTVLNPEPFHVYTADFLAKQIWDSTQIYNYLTNNWGAEDRVKDRPYDSAYEQTREHTRKMLDLWLEQHPEVDVVRFTTFFYHFTLAFNESAQEKFVDWFGYSAAVSIPALEDFYKEYGYWLTPEDFVDSGHYNSPFRTPTPKFLEWIDFTARRVAKWAGVLVQQVHDKGREAIMFLGDNWMGTEPYGPYFPSIKLDGVVGSVGSGATCRMISDIPGVKYTEGRFLPYFFPDVFRPGGDPTREASASWAQARRAIVRKPLDRIGYGGYLSLALQFPEFIDRIEEIVEEFRSIHDLSEGELPQTERPVVAILNAWGSLRTWQTNMVAHALWYKQIHGYMGVIEALAGLPFDVRFLSFDDVLQSEGEALADVDVLINAGALDTAFSGGDAWNNPELQTLVRKFVWDGGGFVGVGAPTGRTTHVGPIFALEDVIGADMELHWSLSTTRYWTEGPKDHFLLQGLEANPDAFLLPDGEAVPVRTLGDREGTFGHLDVGQALPGGEVIATGPDFEVLAWSEGSVSLGVNPFGKGRAVYIAGLPYSAENARLLHRAIMWSAGKEGEWGSLPVTDNPQIEVAWYPGPRRVFVFNNSWEPQTCTLSLPTGVSGADPRPAGVPHNSLSIELDGYGSVWLEV